MPDVLDNSVTISLYGEDFVLRVPSPLDMARIGVEAGAIRRTLDPLQIGNEECVDWHTAKLIRGLAYLKVLCEKSTATWVFSEVDAGRGTKSVSVDITKLPPKSTKTLVELAEVAAQAIERFLEGGDQDGQPLSTETVAS